MCPKPFSWAKNKENFFPTGSREGAALKQSSGFLLRKKDDNQQLVNVN